MEVHRHVAGLRRGWRRKPEFSSTVVDWDLEVVRRLNRELARESIRLLAVTTR